MPLKTAICIGTNGDGVRYAHSDAEAIKPILQDLGYSLGKLSIYPDGRIAVSHGQADLLYLAGPADHRHIGCVAVGACYLDVRELASLFRAMILDTCKVGRLLQPAGKTPVLAAAEEYAFEADQPERGSIFGYWLRRWLSTCDTLDVTDWAMHTYIATHVMEATGIQVVRFGYL